MQFSFLVQLASALSIAAQGNLSSKSRLVESAKEHFNCRTGADLCHGVTAKTALDLYLCGDYHLGPKTSPTVFPVVNLIFMYDRLGGLCPREFLNEHTDENGSFIYPPKASCSMRLERRLRETSSCQSVPWWTASAVRLTPTAESRSYLSPAFAPYIQRAIPPINLNPPRTPITPPAGRSLFPNSYNLYNVTMNIEVIAGPIAPAFGQPGHGTQYKTSEDVATLVNEGFLQRVYPENLVGPIIMLL